LAIVWAFSSLPWTFALGDMALGVSLTKKKSKIYPDLAQN